MSRRARRIVLWSVSPLVLALALFALGVLWPLPSATPVRTDHPVAFIGATLVDVEQGISVPGRTVLIDRGRIAAVGREGAVDLPQRTVRIDARGLYVMPGLWDMHAHVYAISPLLDLPLYVAYGVTNVRDMQSCPKAGDPFIACPAEKRRWSREAQEGRRVGPRIVATTSFMANGPGMRERLRGVPHFFGTATPEEARAFVQHQAAQGADAIKVYDRLPREAYFALVAEARRLGLDVVGHRPLAVSAVEAAAAGQKSIEHARVFLHEAYPGSVALRAAAEGGHWREERRRMVDEHDPDIAQAIFGALVEHDTWYVPTHLTRWVDAYADDPAVRQDSLLRYLHPLMKWQWLEDVDATVAGDPSPEARQAHRDFYHKGLELTGAAHRAGVKILAGTDYIVPGADLHRELVQLVAAGLSPAEALKTATLNPALYFGMESEYGAIGPGKVADLLLLEADPLVDVRNTQRIRAVVFNGNLYDRDALDGLRARVGERARSWSVACKILWRFLQQPVNY
jgi:imidazolonepropionase-like amidohydrolase